MLAARRGKTKVVLEVVKAGANLNLQDSVRSIDIMWYNYSVGSKDEMNSNKYFI